MALPGLGLIQTRQGNKVITAPGPNLGLDNEEEPLAQTAFRTTPLEAPTGAAPAPGPIQFNTPSINDFSFNPKYSQLDQGFLRKGADAGLQFNQTKADIDANYQTAASEADRMKQQAIKRLRERLSF